MKSVMIIFMLALVNLSSGQVASDYYNKPHQQELFASVSQESTFVHKAGFLACFNSVYNWANKNRNKYGFLSVTSNDSLGIVQVTSTFDCQTLVSNNHPGTLSTCNLILTSCTNALKIAYADLKSRDCAALWRISIQKELVHMIAAIPDSVATVARPAPHISRGLVITRGIDSIFAKIKEDSIAQARADSIAAIPKVVIRDTEPIVNLAAACIATDSISLIVERDSIAENKQAAVIFKGQLNLKVDVSLDTKLECLTFLCAHKLRTTDQVETYLVCLKKLYDDKRLLYYAARETVPENKRYLCVLYYKKMQKECSKVQNMMSHF
jgi:hypothetical protein